MMVFILEMYKNILKLKVLINAYMYLKFLNKYFGTIESDRCVVAVLKLWRLKMDCVIYEMLFIGDIRPKLNTQSDSIRSKVFNIFK